MKTISIAIPESDYEAFRRAAEVRDGNIEVLIREAIALYRGERLESREPLRDVPVLSGPRLVGDLPSRFEIYEEIFGSESSDTELLVIDPRTNSGSSAAPVG